MYRDKVICRPIPQKSHFFFLFENPTTNSLANLVSLGFALHTQKGWSFWLLTVECNSAQCPPTFSVE